MVAADENGLVGSITNINKACFTGQFADGCDPPEPNSAGHARDRARLEQERAMAELNVRFETLTPRERDVMALVVCGRLNKQIACDLSVSEITVKVHRGQVMRKMRASSLPDLARMPTNCN
jgi:FixJ family two-component response regulator